MEEQMSFPPSMAAIQDRSVDRLVSKPLGAGRIWNVCQYWRKVESMNVALLC
jgi:hypothetical protein